MRFKNSKRVKILTYLVLAIMFLDILVLPTLNVIAESGEEDPLDSEGLIENTEELLENADELLENTGGSNQEGISEGDQIPGDTDSESDTIEEDESTNNSDNEDQKDDLDKGIPIENPSGDLGLILDEKMSEIDFSDYVDSGWIQVEGEWLKIVSEETVNKDSIYLDENNIPYYKGLPVHEYSENGVYLDDDLALEVSIGAKQKLLTGIDHFDSKDLSLGNPNMVMFRTFSFFSTSSNSGKIRDKSSGIRNTGKRFEWAEYATHEFYIQDQRAFCIEWYKPSPITNASGYSKISPFDSIPILRALYYGAEGEGSIFPNTTQGRNQGAIVTTLVLTRLYDEHLKRGHPDAQDRTWVRGYNKLMAIAKGVTLTDADGTRVNGANYETPNTDVKFTTSNKDNKVTVSVSNGVQKSNTITFDTFSKNSTKITLKDNVKLVRTSSKSGRDLKTYSNEVTIYGGDKFHFTAPLSKGGNFSTGALSGSLPRYTPVVTVYSGVTQSLGALEAWDDPKNTATITVPFKAQTANVKINHIDLSRPKSHAKRIFKTETKSAVIGTKYKATRMTNKHLKDNYTDPYIRHTGYDNSSEVTVSSKGNTINLYYTTQWDLTVLYKDNQNGSTFRNAGTTTYVYDASYKHVSPEWSTNTGKNSVRHYDKKHYDYRNDYGGKTSRTKANRTKSGKMPRKNLTLEFTFDPHGYVGVEWKNLFPEKGYDVFDKTLNPTLSDTRTGVDPLNKKGNKVVWTGIGSKLRTEFDMYQHGTKFEYSQPRFITVGDRTYERENDSKYKGSVGYQVYPVQTGSTYTPHQFKYRLIREVTVNYLDDRTGEPIAEPKKYEVKQGYNPSTGKEPKVTTTLLNNGYAWTEEPPVFKDDKTGYEYNYVRHDGSPESGVVGTDHIEINYYYNQPLAKVELEKLQIYTAKSDEGLPVVVELGKVLNYETGLTDNDNKDLTITLALYEGDVKLDKKVYTANEFPSKAEFKVETDLLESSGTTGLTINEIRPYTVKLEDYDPNHFRVDDAVDWRIAGSAVQIIEGKGKLTTDGYTSSEETLTFNPVGSTSYEYVVMTEITPTTPMELFHETFEFNVTQLDKQKSGYGVATDLEYTYTNELNDKYNFATSISDPDDISNKPDFIFNAPEELKDETLNHFKSSGWVSLTMEDTVNSRVLSGSQPFSYNVKYDFPNIHVEKQTGDLYTDDQVATLGLDPDTLRDAGNLFFSPVWAEIKDYDVYYSILEQGAHKVNFSIEDVWEIYAQMMLTIDSNTKDLDEIVFSPINADKPFAGGNPDNWTDTDKEWLMYWKEEEN